MVRESYRRACAGTHRAPGARSAAQPFLNTPAAAAGATAPRSSRVERENKREGKKSEGCAHHRARALPTPWSAAVPAAAGVVARTLRRLPLDDTLVRSSAAFSAFALKMLFRQQTCLRSISPWVSYVLRFYDGAVAPARQRGQLRTAVAATPCIAQPLSPVKAEAPASSAARRRITHPWFALAGSIRCRVPQPPRASSRHGRWRGRPEPERVQHHHGHH